MTDSHLLFREIAAQNGAIGEITLNRPAALNALTHDMCLGIAAQLTQWENASHIKAVVIRAVPGNAFCAGGDVRRLHEHRSAGNQFFKDEYEMNHRIFHFPKPYIALLDGITMGGGAGVSLHGSHRVATERLVFAMPETGIGFFPDVGGSYFLSRCPDKIGVYLGLTSARLNVADALYAELVDYYVPSGSLDTFVQRLASTHFSAEKADSCIDDILHSLAKTPEPSILAKQASMIKHCFSASSVEAILSALHAENNDWSSHVIQTLLTKSPMSLKITLKEMNTAAHLQFDDCMQLEYQLAKRFLADHDFYEGVRAALIDKDKNPQWKPAELNAITDEMISHYFEKLPGEDSLDLRD